MTTIHHLEFPEGKAQLTEGRKLAENTELWDLSYAKAQMLICSALWASQELITNQEDKFQTIVAPLCLVFLVVLCYEPLLVWGEFLWVFLLIIWGFFLERGSPQSELSMKEGSSLLKHVFSS